MLGIPALADDDAPDPEPEEQLVLVEPPPEPDVVEAEDPTPSDDPLRAQGDLTPQPAELAQAAVPEDDPPVEAELEEEPQGEERHVRLDDDVATADVAPDTNRVASRSVHVPEDRRAPVPSLDWGPVTPGQVGAAGQVGNASPKTRSVTKDDGAKNDDDAEEVARKRSAKTVRRDEVQDADGRDRGKPTAAGPKSVAERDGGKDGADLAGEGARERSVASAGRPAQKVEGSLASPPPAPDGWEPHTVRVIPSEGKPAPSLKASDLDGQLDTDAAVPVQARAEVRPRATGDGGEGEVRAPEPSFEEDAPAVAELEDEGEPVPEAARAWGGEQRIDPDTEAGATGRVALVGAQATTTKTNVEREVQDGDRTAVSAREHELGPYRDELEDGIHDRWMELTPLEVRAMGLQGTSVVRFEVDHRGRVVQKTLVKRSGYTQLDDLALASVPVRVRRPPSGAADPTFEHTLEFSYTDRWASTQ